MAHRILVLTRPDLRDPAGETVRAGLAEDLDVHVDDVRVVDVYTLAGNYSAEEIEKARLELFTDAVIHESVVGGVPPINFDYLIEVGFRPGVTDNVGKSASEGMRDVLGRDLGSDERVYKSTQFAIQGAEDAAQCDRIARDMLANDLIQRWTVFTRDELELRHGETFDDLPVVTDESDPTVHEVDLELDDERLMRLSREGLLALELTEMKAIRDYYRDDAVRTRRTTLGLPQSATDIEVEILAQTWSEHCKHKIFAATIDFESNGAASKKIDGLFKTYVKATTDEVQENIDWLVSVFDDNAGIVKFDDNWHFALKAETHNSPSALDPYGGAMTGIVGVNRDILGAGMGCRCIFNTDVFCFASPEFDEEIPARLFHPKRVMRGVHRGVKDGGNESGIPDVNGAIVFHERFLGKPLVFCGTGGLIPATVQGKPSHEKSAEPGDLIVMVGGRIGKDGIHGATFSSEELHEGSPATAVQIGDPITQKKMANFLMEARDLGLYSCITDNGAGGLSSSVGEMARSCGGCVVHLDKAPLKYVGLAPWEIFLSEAQERMTLAVRPETLDALSDLARRREVEVTALGEFTDSGLLECYYKDQLIASLDMEFLHDGVPVMHLKARWTPPELEPERIEVEPDLGVALKEVLGTFNTCSKETFVRMYDHEVLGQSVLKQFQGVEADGPGDAAVIRPVAYSDRGISIACGICPKFSDIDTYSMMASAIDEAVRNLICVGTQPGTIAGLDNFCWPDPVQSEKTPDGEYKLGQLVRCCEALKEVCLAYGIPLISGKDSMKNDYKIGDTKISIPPTVLFTASGIVPDVRRSVSMDAKQPGDRVYVLGDTLNELGGSEFLNVRGQLGTNAPTLDAATAFRRYQSLHDAIQEGLVASCHDCSDGGLAVALAETAFSGGFGMDLDLSHLSDIGPVAALFSESNSRIVATVSEANVERFEASFADQACYALGMTTSDNTFSISMNDDTLMNVPITELKEAWQHPLRG